MFWKSKKKVKVSKNLHSAKPSPILVFIDEVGDVGRKQTSYKYFGFGVSIVDDPKAFAEISRQYKQDNNITKKLKARKLPPEDKLILSKKINLSGAKTLGIYVDKRMNTPKGWMDEVQGSEIQI